MSGTRFSLGLASVVLAGLLFLGFKAPQDAALVSNDDSGSGASSGHSSPVASASSGGGTSGGASGGSTKSGTFDGTIVNTRYGPVEVEIKVSNGKVTAAIAIESPSGGRSGAISGYAVPILSSEAVTAQSANIDLVSGATYTSQAYARSLQSALDQAGL